MVNVLLIWDHRRKDLLDPFNKLKGDFNFTFLYHPFSKDEDINPLPGKLVYWSDFDDPFLLLDSLKPDKIIFGDIETFPEVALNLAAKRYGIPTAILDHGLKELTEIENSYKGFKRKTSEEAGSTKSKTTRRFYIHSLKKGNFTYFLDLFRFARIRKYNPPVKALDLCKGLFRLPDTYLCIGEANAAYYKERDWCSDNKLQIIGNAFLDNLAAIKNDYYNAQGNYFLLLDVPSAEIGHSAVTQEEKTGFYLRLANYCAEKNKQLVVKLHPRSYLSEFLPSHVNIQYNREANDLAKLISDACAVFGFHSSLMPYTIWFRATCLFMVDDYPFQEKADEFNMCPVYKMDHIPNEIPFLNSRPKGGDADNFFRMYLYKADGEASSRLKEWLNK